MKIKAIIASVLLLFVFKHITAQVTASFTADVVSGCSPLKVTYTNNSSGTNLVYVWEFGNGNTSGDKDPQAIYTNPGKYTVTLTATDGSSTDETSIEITVFANPTASFIADDTQGCTPFNVQFNNSSTLGDAPIETYNWDFRSGFVDNRENPTYSYTSAGFYDVYLEVIDTNGCSSFKEEQNFIEVVSSPTSIFSTTPSVACGAPAEVSFSNYSSGSGTLSFDWDFGDETSSTENAPTHTFNEIGDYIVKLTVNSDEYGCSTSTTQLFQIKNIVANGTIKQNTELINDGDLICPGEINYSSTSTGTENIYWVFGDGEVSYDANGTHSFQNGGIYTVMLIADPGDLCADTVKWDVEVDSVNANFTFSPDRSCSSPTEVTFTDSSTNAVSWFWEFDDGTTSTDQNPVHTYTVPKNNDEYAVNNPESFITSLTVESSNGCTHKRGKGFVIEIPTSRIHADTLRGCLPLSVNFSETSISDLPITNYEWIFGDGQTTSGGTSNASHTYNTNGEYDAKLVITNNDGCTDTSYHLTIEVGKTLSPDFILSSTNVCQNEVITFTQNTPEANLVDFWNYSVNNVHVIKSELPNHLWTVETDTGYLDVGLSVVYNGCESSTIKADHLYSKGPVADFEFLVDCQTPFVYDFIAKPKKYDSFLWDFGDGTTESGTLNPQHTYLTEANRTAKIILTNGACTDTIEKDIKIRQPNAIISAIGNACSGDSILFDPTGSYNQVDYCFEKYYWDFNDSLLANVRTSKDSLYYVFNKGGEFDVDLITYYDNGCFDTATHHIQIFSPELKFEIDSFVGCAPVLVTFNDSSESYVYKMKQWEIDFGDGVDSIYNNQVTKFSHIYNNVGSFEVNFSITDSIGCSANFTENVYVGNPNAGFNTLTNTEICAGNPIIFAPVSQNNDSVLWNFGDGVFSRDTSNIITHQYDSVGNFQASLIVYEFGCSDTSKTPGFIKVQKADAFFTASDTFYNCYPREITFEHTDSRSEIRVGRWEFGYKENYSDYDSTRKFTYPLPGEYTIRLDIETTFGCEDNFERKVILTGPQGNFDISPDTACSGSLITLEVKDTTNVYNFEWDLGDGKVVQGNPIQHVYNDIGNVYPKLVLYGDSVGSCIPPPFEDTLYIYELKADIGLEDSSLCENTDIVFTNATFGHSVMMWDFGDGSTSQEFQPTHSFSTGNYNITLLASNDYGCTDTMKQSVIVNALPQLTLSPDTLICYGGSALLRANGGDAISWLPTTYLGDSTVYFVHATPDSTITYTAIVTDSITGCENSDDITINVQQIPNVSVSPLEASLFVGEEIHFEVDSVSGYIYEWSPAEFFNCATCANATALPLNSTTLALNVKDNNDCFTVPYSIIVTVDERYSVDVPTAFTPNGDGTNDIIYVNGWGIQNLISFRIFNRWGNEVFFSDDITHGWDGTYKGKQQNMDTYVYVVEVEMFDGSVVKKTGTITLLQ